MRHFFRHFFTPHHSNNHRAKLLHHSTLFIIIVGLLFSSLSINLVEKQEGVLGISSNISADELLLLTNLKRQERGLPPLVMSGSLSQAASQKATDMFSKNYWAHVAPDGTTPWVFIRGAGYEYIYAGENLARGFTTSSEVVEAWMNSPSHRENMLSPNYQEIGFAIQTGTLTGDETVLVVEMLGSRSRAIAQEIATAKVAEPTQASAVSPTPQVIQQVTPTPTSLPVLQLTPTPTPILRVAAVKNDPLIDKQSLQKNVAIGIVFILSSALIFDMIGARRQKLVRLLSHNLDHLVFFGIILIIILLLTGGVII